MIMPEVNNESPKLAAFLQEKAASAGLDAKHIEALPLPYKQLLHRLDSLHGSPQEKGPSMLDESLMSAVWLQDNPELVGQLLGVSDQDKLAQMQESLITSTLISDEGKVTSPEMIWLYQSLYFDTKQVKEKIGPFLQKHNPTLTHLSLMELPYSVAMNFYRELNFNGSEGNNEWDQKRGRCRDELTKMGFAVSSDTPYAESTFHEVMTGAHLVTLSTQLKEWGMSDIVAENHHLSRGLLRGRPVTGRQPFLASILPQENPDLWLRACLLEEMLDMTVASCVRQSRHGDNHGTDPVSRIEENLDKSLAAKRINPTEFEQIHETLGEMGNAGKITRMVQSVVAGCRD